jgi:hypothetical protein
MQFAGEKESKKEGEKKKVLLQVRLSLYVIPECALEGPQDYWRLSPPRASP